MVDGPFRGVIKVLCQMQRRVRNTFESGNARHIDDVRLSRALDDIDAIEVDTERPATAQGDLTQLRLGREGFPVFVLLGPGWKGLLHAEKPAADRVDFPVAAFGRVVALDDDGRLAGRHGGELGDAADDANSKPAAVLTRLDYERSRAQERLQPIEARDDVSGGRGHPCRL